mmetsp:Transcript_35391/g.79835  ORF Transcript_35391/g.79835 Transcript_35391/m.79835 type:complete len:200 (-) Transcript_35391:452-1051(-)
MLLSQELPQGLDQPVVGRLGEVTYPGPCRVSLATRGAYDDAGHTTPPALAEQRCLVVEAINQVHHEVDGKALLRPKSVQESPDVAGIHKVHGLRHRALRVDLKEPLLEHGGLEPADGVFERVELPVRVRNAEGVQVHQRELAHPASSERFSRPTAHAANAHQYNVGLAKFCKPRSPIQPCHSPEPKIKITLDFVYVCTF